MLGIQGMRQAEAQAAGLRAMLAPREEDRIESVLVAGGEDRIFAGAQVGNRRLAEEAEDNGEAS